MAQDLIRWPRFAGSARNGRTLSAGLTRKAQIVEQLTGVKLTLIQGSPSDSDASAGTHRGPGNAADWGTSWDTKTDLKVSAAFRMLNCLSMVRGQDADGDGRKDDTFDPHIHVIDLDDAGALNEAQRNQRDAYLNGRNALANNQRDREPRPAKTYTLAEYLAQQEDIDMTKDELIKTLQAEVPKLMTQWAKSKEGKAAIGLAAVSPTYSDWRGKYRPIGDITAESARVGVENQHRINRLATALERIAKKLGA